jgi:hypothetical protein
MHVHVQCYDTQWHPLPEYLNNDMPHYLYDPNDKPISKPKCLKTMLEIAATLSSPFPQLRVDFYVVNGKPVIGEMTFSQGYGFLRKEVYDKLGAIIDINKYK